MPANQHLRTNALISNQKKKAKTKLKNNQSQAVNQVSSTQATVEVTVNLIIFFEHM